MAARTVSELKSADQAAFEHYLRTGEQLTSNEWRARMEAKFNPYHDELGRFTTASGATNPHGDTRLTGAWEKVQGWLGNSPKKPVPNRQKPASAPARARAAAISPPAKNLLTQIAHGEGVGDEVAKQHGYASSYDVPFNYGRFARQSKPLTQMTLREVDDLQTQILNHPDNTHNASPVGKYQIVRKSLRELKVQLGLRDDMVFDQNLQDRLALATLEKRGLKKFLESKISERQFQANLAREWASVADPATGRARQHLGTTTTQIVPLIRALRLAPPRR